jgi:hypothetical protein
VSIQISHYILLQLIKKRGSFTRLGAYEKRLGGVETATRLTRDTPIMLHSFKLVWGQSQGRFRPDEGPGVTLWLLSVLLKPFGRAFQALHSSL